MNLKVIHDANNGSGNYGMFYLLIMTDYGRPKHHSRDMKSLISKM